MLSSSHESVLMVYIISMYSLGHTDRNLCFGKRFLSVCIYWFTENVKVGKMVSICMSTSVGNKTYRIKSLLYYSVLRQYCRQLPLQKKHDTLRKTHIGFMKNCRFQGTFLSLYIYTHIYIYVDCRMSIYCITCLCIYCFC